MDIYIDGTKVDRFDLRYGSDGRLRDWDLSVEGWKPGDRRDVTVELRLAGVCLRAEAHVAHVSIGHTTAVDLNGVGAFEAVEPAHR